MELNFKEYMGAGTGNIPGGMGDTAGGAFMGSDQTGSEDSSDQRGMLPNTDFQMTPTDVQTGRIISIRGIAQPGRRGQKANDGRGVNIGFMDTSNGKTKWINMDQAQYRRYQAAGNSSSGLAIGKMMTVHFQANSLDPDFGKKEVKVDKIVVH